MISIPLIMLLVTLPLIVMWAAYIIELCTDIWVPEWVPEWVLLMGSGAFKIGIAVLVVYTFCMAIKPAKKYFKENVKIEVKIVVDKEK